VRFGAIVEGHDIPVLTERAVRAPTDDSDARASDVHGTVCSGDGRSLL